MEACIGQEATSPIVPNGLPSIDFLTDRNRCYSRRFLLDFNETNRSFALANCENNFK